MKIQKNYVSTDIVLVHYRGQVTRKHRTLIKAIVCTKLTCLASVVLITLRLRARIPFTELS